MIFYDWKFVVAFTVCIMWTVMVFGIILGASAAYEADTAAEASVDVEKAVDEVRDSEPEIDGPMADEIEGTQMEKYDKYLTRDPHVSKAVNEYVVVPAIFFGMTVGDISARVFYDYLMWVPKSVVGGVLRVAGIAPMIGLLGFQMNRAARSLGVLR